MRFKTVLVHAAPLRHVPARVVQPLVTHRFRLEQIEEAYELFANQRDGVLKVAIAP